jgi:hypothetical protein
MMRQYARAASWPTLRSQSAFGNVTATNRLSITAHCGTDRFAPKAACRDDRAVRERPQPRGRPFSQSDGDFPLVVYFAKLGPSAIGAFDPK